MTAKEYLKSKDITDSDFMDLGMVDYISELMENYVKEVVNKNDDLHSVSECAFTEVYLKNKGWQKLLSKGEKGTHEGEDGMYYRVDGYGSVHEKYCEHFR